MRTALDNFGGLTLGLQQQILGPCLSQFLLAKLELQFLRRGLVGVLATLRITD